MPNPCETRHESATTKRDPVELGRTLEAILGLLDTSPRKSGQPAPDPPAQSMADETLVDEADRHINPVTTETTTKSTKAKSRGKDKDSVASAKRRCVSTACIACRRRKSKVCETP